MKRIAAVMLAGLLLTIPTVSGFGASATHVVYNGETKYLAKELYMQDEKVLISLREAAGLVGASAAWDSQKGTALVNLSGDTYEFKPGSTQVIKENAIAVSIARPVENLNGSLYVPLSVFSDLWGCTVTLSQGNYSIESKSSALAKGVAIETLINEAVSNSTSYNKAKLNIEKGELSYDDAKEALGNTMPYETGNSASEAQRYAAYQAYFSSNVGLETAKKALETERTKIENNVYKWVETIQSGVRTMALLEKQIRVTEIDYGNSKLKYELGLLSKMDYEKAGIALDTLKQSYRMQELVVGKAWSDLNFAVGRKIEARYEIQYTPAFQAFDGTVDTIYSDALSDSPDIYALEQQIELANNGVRYYVYNYSSSSYDIKAMDVTLAKNTLASTKKTYYETILSYVNGIHTLEEKQLQLYKAYESAKLDAEKALKSYSAGLATQLDYEKASLQVLAAENSLKDNEISHIQTVRAVQKIWALN